LSAGGEGKRRVAATAVSSQPSGSAAATVILGERALASRQAGRVLGVRESAGKQHHGSITHAGSEPLRWILLQVA